MMLWCNENPVEGNHNDNGGDDAINSYKATMANPKQQFIDGNSLI